MRLFMFEYLTCIRPSVRNKKSHLFIFFNAFNIPLFVIIFYYLLLLFAFRFSFLATAF